jgi:hypothetical protein
MSKLKPVQIVQALRYGPFAYSGPTDFSNSVLHWDETVQIVQTACPEFHRRVQPLRSVQNVESRMGSRFTSTNHEHVLWNSRNVEMTSRYGPSDLLRANGSSWAARRVASGRPPHFLPPEYRSSAESLSPPGCRRDPHRPITVEKCHAMEALLQTKQRGH